MNWKNDAPLRTKLIFGYAVILAIMVATSLVSHFSISSIIETEEWVIHTNEVIGDAHAIEGSIIDMETGLRGFIITGTREFLEPYERGQKEYAEMQTHLNNHVSDNPSQIEKVREIDKLVQDWLDSVAKEEIKLRITDLEGPIHPEIIAMLPIGKGKMGNIRLHIQEFINVEKGLLETRQQEATTTARHAVIFLIVSTVIACLAGIVLTIFITRNVLTQVGGEPSEIASLTERIATGDLNVAVEKETTGIFHSVVQMMHSLKENKDQIYIQNEQLKEANDSLEIRVAQRTDELLASNAELSQFAYVASHDLKAPLRAVFNLSSWIAEDLKENLDVTDHVELLQQRVKRMESLINGLLEFSRIGRMEVNKEKLNIQRVIKEVEVSLETVTEKSFEVKFIEANPTRMIQLFSNLINNAVKHHNDPDNIKIEISNRDVGDCVEFCVSDNGPGIESKYHDKIFQIFQTLEPKDSTESTGIGLSLVKKIVEEYKGKIWVISKEGEGAKFYFTLHK